MQIAWIILSHEYRCSHCRRNIPQIIESLSMSCIDASGERVSIFRYRSFTQFKYDRDFKGRFDSAAVSESISSSMTKLSSTGLSVLLPTFLQISTLETLVVNVPFWVNWWTLLIPRAQKYLTFRSGFPGLSDAVEVSTFGSLTLYRETKFIIGFDFVVTRHYFRTIGKTEMVKQHKRWFH